MSARARRPIDPRDAAYVSVRIPPPPLAVLVSGRDDASRRKVRVWIRSLVDDYKRGRCGASVLIERATLAIERGAWGRSLSEREAAAAMGQVRLIAKWVKRTPIRSRNQLPSVTADLVRLLVDAGYTNVGAAARIGEDTGLPISARQVSRLRNQHRAK